MALGSVVCCVAVCSSALEGNAQAAPRAGSGSGRRAAPNVGNQPGTRASREQEPRGDDTQTDAGGARHPLQEVMEFAAESRTALQDVKDYTAVFTKTELVGNRMVKQVMDMKFREKPFSVYFRFRSPQEQGREVIYVDGANNGHLLAHGSGIEAIAGTMSLRLNDRKVMEENRYPITKVGISNLLETAYQIWETEQKTAAPQDVEVKFFPNAKLGDILCQAVQITHKRPHRELRYSLSRVYFDKETKLPVRAERYGWPSRQGEKAPLVEEYTYSNLRTNVGLKNGDFDPRNPNYGF
jgi:outer membrane lipoprotein-sorting protein